MGFWLENNTLSYYWSQNIIDIAVFHQLLYKQLKTQF